MTETQTSGLAWLCDRAGVIQQILCDDLSPNDAGALGQSFTDRVDPASRDKAGYLLAEVQTQGAAFDWELNVPISGRVVTLHFSGVANGDSLLMVAARNRNGLGQLYEELMRINNEQVNALRLAIKDQAELARGPIDREHSEYDELTRLNNELIDLQRELARKNAELERLNQQKNQFLGMAAHDLRNPLGVIMAYSEFLIDELTSQPSLRGTKQSSPDAPEIASQKALAMTQAEFACNIYKSSEFMLRLINDLLDVSAIESGQVRLDLQPIDLGALVKRNLTLNQLLAERKHITLHWFAPDSLPPLLADAGKLEQVLNNLISNAIKFSHPQSTVEISVTVENERVVLAVRDHGQGIPAAELDRLFKPFSRTSVKSTAGESSTGLGLSITRKIIVEHGGDIRVESAVGQGSTFYVALPVANNQESLND